MFYEAYTSPWINDEYKVSSRLTLTLGLRFDYQFARTETQDRYSTFSLAPYRSGSTVPARRSRER